MYEVGRHCRYGAGRLKARDLSSPTRFVFLRAAHLPAVQFGKLGSRTTFSEVSALFLIDTYPVESRQGEPC